MNAELMREYRKFRAAGIGGIVGHDAARCLDAARTVIRFRELEDEGRVRIVARPDNDYEWTDDEERERFGDDGAWGTVGQYTLDPENADDEDHDGGWEWSDSVWGSVGYKDVTSPYENPYVIDIMAQTISELERVEASRCPHCGQPIRKH